MGIKPCPAGVLPAVLRIPVTDDKVARQIIDWEFDPEIHKIPVTKEYMACALGGHVEVENAAVMDCFSDALYESVSGIIFKLARKYSCNSGSYDVNDLANECGLRIFKMIHQFDPSKGQFNTWVWRVSSSVLNRKYQQSRRYSNLFTATDELESYSQANVSPVEINGDVEVVLLELFELYPDKADILRELFYSGDGQMYVPDRISMRQVAEKLGHEYSYVYSFVRNKIRPFVFEKFGDKK